MSLSENLKREINKNKITIRELAEKSGISHGIISEITLGKVKNPGIFTIAKMAKVLGITLDELIEGV